MSDDYRVYRQVAEQAATEAGALLRDAYGRVDVREKRPGDLVTDADIASQRLIAARILRTFPDHTLLAEEEGVGPDPSKPWRWVVDPLDGTINFAHGFPFWSVSIALEREGRLVVGVVHNPLTGETYSAAEGLGATLNGRPLRVSAVDRLGAGLIATARSIASRALSRFRRRYSISPRSANGTWFSGNRRESSARRSTARSISPRSRAASASSSEPVSSRSRRSDRP